MDWEWKKLRHGGFCLSCGAQIERYEFGWHNPEIKKVRCAKCGVPSRSDSQSQVPPKSHESPSPVGGSSALREGRLRRNHNWVKGAAGEFITDQALHKHLSSEDVILADRRVPGAISNIDHVVISSSGIWLIDSKTWRGKIRYQASSSFSLDYRLIVDNKDRTEEIEKLYSQVIPVAEIVGDPSIPIKPALVFVDGDWALSSWPRIIRQKPYEHLGVFITTPNTIAKLIGGAGPLEAQQVANLGKTLDKELKPR